MGADEDETTQLFIINILTIAVAFQVPIDLHFHLSRIKL